MSWKQQALAQCENWYIKIEDHSNAFLYMATLTAPTGYLFYENGEPQLDVVVERHKGSDKSKFWYQIEQIASVGTFTEDYYEDWLQHGKEFDRIQEED
jgi:hypothetical protein